MKLRILSSCWMPLALAGMLVAQEPADPPARVARLNYLDGAVSFRPMSLEDWAPATLNYPLTTGDHLWVDRDSRAELHIGATAIHLAPETAFAILNLDDRVAQMTVSEGTLYLRVPRMEDDEILEIDTPNGAISVLADRRLPDRCRPRAQCHFRRRAGGPGGSERQRPGLHGSSRAHAATGGRR